MKREKNFSYLRDDDLALSISGDRPFHYPLTYTLEEALEDWCDGIGVGFVKVLGCYPDRHVNDLGSGKFSYKIKTHRSPRARRVKRQLYADLYGGVGDETSW